MFWSLINSWGLHKLWKALDLKINPYQEFFSLMVHFFSHFSHQKSAEKYLNMCASTLAEQQARQKYTSVQGCSWTLVWNSLSHSPGTQDSFKMLVSYDKGQIQHTTSDNLNGCQQKFLFSLPKNFILNITQIFSCWEKTYRYNWNGHAYLIQSHTYKVGLLRLYLVATNLTKIFQPIRLYSTFLSFFLNYMCHLWTQRQL